MFTGLSAFPLTPFADDRVDERAFSAQVARLSASGVDSIAVLGSTGSYAYMTRAERDRTAHLAVEHAGSVPVTVGIGALRTSEVLANAASASRAGASAVLLAPVSYQPLTDDDVLELFRAVSNQCELPVIVYDNPGTTHFTFSTELYARIAELPGIASIKIPGMRLTGAGDAAARRVAEIRGAVPERVTIGVSGDGFAAAGLNAGCDVWYSVLAGTLPEPALRIARAAQTGQASEALAESERLAPLWALFAEFGSLRVIAAIAEHLGLAPERCLPLPMQGLGEVDRGRVAATSAELGFAR